MVVLGGEQAPDAALMELSTVPIGVAAEAHLYLAQGGPENLRQLHAFLSDTVLLTGEGFEPPVEQPTWGVLPRPTPATTAPVDAGAGTRPRVGILFYRAQQTAGTPRTCTPWPTRSTPRAASVSRSSPRPCATPRPTCWSTSARWTRW